MVNSYELIRINILLPPFWRCFWYVYYDEVARMCTRSGLFIAVTISDSMFRSLCLVSLMLKIHSATILHHKSWVLHLVGPKRSYCVNVCMCMCYMCLKVSLSVSLYSYSHTHSCTVYACV